MQFEAERVERGAMEQIVNAPPDNLAATNIGIRSWEGEFRVLEAEFKVGIDEGNAEWIQEMAELGCRVEELQGVIAAHEELRELGLRKAGLEEHHCLHDQAKAAFARRNWAQRTHQLKEERGAVLNAADAKVGAQAEG